MQEERRARFEALVGEVGEPLRRYLVRRTDADSAQDVLAEALLVLWRRLDDVPHDAALPWCYAVAGNCLANELRSARRRRGLVSRVGRLAPRPEVDPTPQLPDPELQDALATLRPQDRELVMLWAWEDLPPAEIAVVLGITTNAVNIRLHRARARLADLLADTDVGKSRRSVGHNKVERRATP